MSDIYDRIRKIIYVENSDFSVLHDFSSIHHNIDDHLAKLGESRDSVMVYANKITSSLYLTQINADCIEFFADFLLIALGEHTEAIRIYLEVLKIAAHKSTIYRRLLDIYFYDLTSISRFDFLDNAFSQFQKRIENLDIIFYAMSYTYIGHLMQRLGRFSEARQAYCLAIEYRDESRIYRESEYGNLELNFISEIAKMECVTEKTTSKAPLIIGSVFFGCEYERLFRDVAGASFFCRSNIEEIKQVFEPIVIIFCCMFDKMNLEHSVFFNELKKHFLIKIIIIPDCLISKYPEQPPQGSHFHPSMPYSLSGLLQTCLLIIAKKSKANLINLPPDAVYSNNCASTINIAIKNGYKIIFTPGVRLKIQEVLDILTCTEVQSNLYSNGLSTSELTKIALSNLHPATQAGFVTNKKMSLPGLLFWPISKNGLFMHGFHMHPIFINADLIQRAPIRRFDSIDGDFTHSMILNPEYWDKYIYVETDPNKVMMFELSGSNVPIDIRYDTKKLIQNTGAWITTHMRPFSFWLLKKRIVFGHLDKHHNNSLIAHADNIISSLLSLSQRMPKIEHTDTDFILNSANNSLANLVNSVYSPNIILQNIKSLIPIRIGSNFDEMKIIYSVAVWGISYIENFLNICLPSLLADGNLGGLHNNNSRSLFVLYTRNEDIYIFEKNKQFQRLETIVKVIIIDINPHIFKDKYTVLSNTQSDTVQRSRSFDAVCFLYADFLWAEGSLRFALQKIADGYDGVVSPVPPVIKEKFYQILTTKYDDFVQRVDAANSGFNISIRPRTLIKHTKAILHPMMRDNIVDYKCNTGSPAYVLWLGPNNDLLIRCFHTHPVIIKVMHNVPEYWIPFEKTLDEWFIPNVFKSMDRLYFIKDSDELTIISLTEEDFPTGYLEFTHHLDAAFIARWAENYAAVLHKISFNYYTLWHEHEIVNEEWCETIERSKATSHEVTMRLSIPDVVHRSECPTAYSSRVERVHRFARTDQDHKIIEYTTGRKILNSAFTKKAGSLMPPRMKTIVVWFINNFIYLKRRLWINSVMSYILIVFFHFMAVADVRTIYSN